jgi:hypothetical protein
MAPLDHTLPLCPGKTPCRRPPARAPAWLAGLAILLGAAAPPPAPSPPPTAPGASGASITLAVRSIGGKRGQPLDRRVHAALLVHFDGAEHGFIVQGGPEKVPGLLFDEQRLAGWVIPAADPEQQYTRAVGAYWGESEVREVPTREVRRFTLPALTEAGLRAAVTALGAELRETSYRLDPGPSSNSFVSLLLERLGLPVPPLDPAECPGWGWRPAG